MSADVSRWNIMEAPTKNAHQPLDSAVHHWLLMSMIGRGVPQSIRELVEATGSSDALVRESLARLEANHGVVTHPATLEPWLIHPFSTTPTLFYVESAERGWWAPCIWCALGISVLVSGSTRITTTLGGEKERCEIIYDAGAVTPTGLFAHFPIPVAKAWDNVHQHCACTLVFDGLGAIDDWCERHGIGRGEAVTIEQVAKLARIWYGEHQSPNWRKSTALEAQQKFALAGLTSPHWHVPQSEERF